MNDKERVSMEINSGGKSATIEGESMYDLMNQFHNAIRGVPNGIRFKKVKYAGDPLEVEVQYQKINSQGDWDDYTLKTRSEPHPDFVDALRGLDNHLQGMAEQYDSLGDPAVCDAKSVSLSWTNDVMGLVISGSRTLRNAHSPLNINTPHKTAEPYGAHEDDMSLLSDACIMDLENFLRETWAFIDGKRRQGDLFQAEDAAAESK